MKSLRFAALGAALAYFFDPQNGRSRRKNAIKRLGGISRRQGGRLAGRASSQARGLAAKATHLREEPKPQPDDVTLARKVETEIFRDAEVPKGQINVNAEDGRVVLRGEVESSEMIEELVSKARKVQGVQDVESLLHTPGEPAPMHQ
ncbi:MAG: BON domain-containing protein [Gaiellaceae bacterium]